MDIEKVLSIKNFRSQLQRKGDCGNILSNDLIECCVKRESVCCIKSRKPKEGLKNRRTVVLLLQSIKRQ